MLFVFFFSSRRRHTRSDRDWSSDVCSSDLKLKRDFRPDQKRKDGGGKRRKDADADFRLSKARFGSSNNEVSESRELRAATDGRTVHDADDRLAEFEHAGESGVEGVEHLEDTLGRIFADVD